MTDKLLIKNCTPTRHRTSKFKCFNYDECKNNICRNCSYIIDGKQYCAICRDDVQREAFQKNGICPNCDIECDPIYENNGYLDNEGQSRNEIVGWYPCPNCGYDEDYV